MTVSNMNPGHQELATIISQAERLYSESEVEAAIDKLAVDVTECLKDKNPVILCLMTGAVVLLGKLLTKLRFQLEIDYVHATRYRGDTSGNSIKWLKYPELELAGRNVLLVDDILDEGHTIAAVVDECRKRAAIDIYTCVLIDKQLNRHREFERADFTGLTVPDRYVFGYGMDYKGYLRNSPGIFAVKEA